MENLPKIKITELFMAKADWNRTFIGRIIRSTNEDGKPFVYSEIPVNDCLISAAADNEDILGKNLDDIVILVLDHKINENCGVFINYLDRKMFLN